MHVSFDADRKVTRPAKGRPPLHRPAFGRQMGSVMGSVLFYTSTSKLNKTPLKELPNNEEKHHFREYQIFNRFSRSATCVGVFRRALFKNQTLLTKFRHLSHACSRFTTNITQNVLYPIFSRTPTRNKQNSKNSWISRIPLKSTQNLNFL